jgi:hypothetical protein
MYGVILASESLLAKAVCQTTGPVWDYYVKHFDEERNHVTWLAADLHTVGVIPPLVHWRAARLAGTQFYLIEHVSPVALLGYMAALECRPMALVDVERLEDWHGKPLLRTLRYHAEHDTQHGPEILALIETLSGQDRDLVLNNAAHTAWLLSGESNGL